METLPLGDTKRKLLDRLKRADALTVGVLARELGITAVAVRQHLEALEEHGLVGRSLSEPQGPGRPADRWSLTALAHELFPDRHGDLTVSLIESIRRAVGDEGLDRVIDARTERQLGSYREEIPAPGEAPLVRRVAALAHRRTAEGYMAEVVEDGDGMLLVENHCPICDAASACLGLCRSELELFQEVLGDGVTVERVQHLLSGDRRCTYRIRPVDEP